MPKFERDIQLPGKSADELYQKTSSGLDHFLGKLNLGHFDLVKDDQKRSISLNSKVATAHLTCKEEKIELKIELSWMAAPFKAKIEQAIDRWLEKIV